MVGEKRFKFDQMILAGIIHTGVHPCQRFGFGNKVVNIRTICAAVCTNDCHQPLFELCNIAEGEV